MSVEKGRPEEIAGGCGDLREECERVVGSGGGEEELEGWERMREREVLGGVVGETRTLGGGVMREREEGGQSGGEGSIWGGGEVRRDVTVSGGGVGVRGC